jgi:hypothetical protein
VLSSGSEDDDSRLGAAVTSPAAISFSTSSIRKDLAVLALSVSLKKVFFHLHIIGELKKAILLPWV